MKAEARMKNAEVFEYKHASTSCKTRQYNLSQFFVLNS